MSKFHYLLIVLILTATGAATSFQLSRASRAACELTARETIRLIDSRLQDAITHLKRSPNAGAEFRNHVLARLDLSPYHGRIRINQFIPGDALKPAIIRITVFSPNHWATAEARYYGADYITHPHLRGKLTESGDGFSKN